MAQQYQNGILSHRGARVWITLDQIPEQ